MYRVGRFTGGETAVARDLGGQAVESFGVIRAYMTSVRVAPSSRCQTVHIVCTDHRLRAEISMAIVRDGGHAETYEDIAELSATKPKAGTILASSELGSAAQLLEQFRAANVHLPLILFAKDPLAANIVKAVHEGAANYLAWPFTGKELLNACTYCQTFMEVEGGRLQRQRQARALVDGLTNREKQILAFLLEGHSSKSRANALALSPRTVEDYRLSTLKKLGVQATSAAIRVGLEAGLQMEFAVAPPGERARA